MARKDLMALYGRLGLIVAAFAFIAGIVAGPVLQKVWSPQVTVAANEAHPASNLPGVPVILASDKVE